MRYLSKKTSLSPSWTKLSKKIDEKNIYNCVFMFYTDCQFIQNSQIAFIKPLLIFTFKCVFCTETIEKATKGKHKTTC